MSHPVDLREVLISLATAALVAAEADAAQTGQLIFRDEWKPTPRTRNSTTQTRPRNAGGQTPSWLTPLLNRLGTSEPLQPQQDQPSPSTTLTAPAPPPAPAPAPAPPASGAAALGSQTPKRLPQPQLQGDDAVKKLLEDNDDVFDKLINHPFPQSLGDGSASLDGFRYYMIQDTLYLETCARLKMLAVARSPNFKDIENFFPRHTSSLEYVKKSKETLISMLGVPESIIDSTPRSKNLDASEKYYLTSVREEDAFFAYYVVLLPCVLSYWRIAESLMDNPSTLRNVVYHPAWIEINYDRSSADKYIKFINANIMAKGGVDRWNHIFRTACLLEADLFNTGLRAPTPYQIVPNGTYSIQCPSAESVALANKNVVLRSPFDKRLGAYFPSDAGSSVVGVKKTGGDNEQWHVVATKDGYTFRNFGTGHYLGIATELDRKEGRILQAVVNPYYWWVNPVQSQPSKESSLYKIFETKNLKYTLHADIEILNSVNRARSTKFDHTPVIARENFEASCQMWSFELERPELVNPGEETRQELLKKPQGKMDAKEVAKKIAGLIGQYEKYLQEEIEEIEQLREKRSDEIGHKLVIEARKDIKAGTSKEAMKKMEELFRKYERVLGDELDAIERQRREHNEMKRQELLEEARKVTDNEGTRKLAELFEKYERMLQEEFEVIEQSRKENIEGTMPKLLEVRKDIDKMDAQEVTNRVKKYRLILREEVEAGGQLRTVYHEEVREELLAEKW